MWNSRKIEMSFHCRYCNNNYDMKFLTQKSLGKIWYIGCPDCLDKIERKVKIQTLNEKSH